MKKIIKKMKNHKEKKYHKDLNDHKDPKYHKAVGFDQALTTRRPHPKLSTFLLHQK